MKSIKQESILKQFQIYFLVASIIPLFILVYILYQFATAGKINNFKFLVALAGIFSFLGFWGTRSFLLKIVSLTNKLKIPGELDKIDKDKILELAQGNEEVAQIAKVFSEIVGDLEENIKELKETKATLYQVLSKIGQTVGSMENFDLLIQFVLETIVDALGAERGAIFFLEEDKRILKPKAIVGIAAKSIPSEIKIGEETVGWVAKEKKPLMVPSLDASKGNSLFSPPLISTPLVVQDKVLGAICISGRKRNDNFSEEELRILLTLAYQIAVSFENINLNREVEKVYFETISALALAVEAKDPYSRGHSERVSKYAVKIAESLGLTQEDLSTLRDSARLHDIGKIGITDEILHKNGKLNNDELATMNKHTLIGEGIVKPLKSFYHIINPIKHHHEFLDGSGYPDGLKGYQIPPVTRILTVADIFDALTTDRPYRKALSTEEARRELEVMVESGKVEKMIVDTLFKLIGENNLLSQ
jgi:HD-GYP domain-containing protein (c-di-GMP phosphodiesterase class II)